LSSTPAFGADKFAMRPPSVTCVKKVRVEERANSSGVVRTNHSAVERGNGSVVERGNCSVVERGNRSVVERANRSVAGPSNKLISIKRARAALRSLSFSSTIKTSKGDYSGYIDSRCKNSYFSVKYCIAICKLDYALER
jgi:hypothetical protein